MLTEKGVRFGIMQKLAGEASSETAMDVCIRVGMDAKHVIAEIAANVFSCIGQRERLSVLIEDGRSEVELGGHRASW